MVTLLKAENLFRMAMPLNLCYCITVLRYVFMRYLVIHLLYSLLTNIVDVECRISFFTVIRRFISVLDKEAKVLELISRENSKKFMRMTSARSMDFVSFTGNLGKYIYQTC